MGQWKSGLSYHRQLCLEMGSVSTDSADKSFPDWSSLLFMQGIPICVNSYAMKYLPITVDNMMQKGLPFNHVIKCGTKFFGLISQHQQQQQCGRARQESTTSWGNHCLSTFACVVHSLRPRSHGNAVVPFHIVPFRKVERSGVAFTRERLE